MKGGTRPPCPIDENALEETFGDDPAIFREILADFVEPARSNIKEIEDAYRDRDTSAVRSAAHKLKPSARALGAHELADHCGSLERSGAADDWPTMEGYVLRLPSVMTGIEHYIGSLWTSNPRTLYGARHAG